MTVDNTHIMRVVESLCMELTTQLEMNYENEQLSLFPELFNTLKDANQLLEMLGGSSLPANEDLIRRYNVSVSSESEISNKLRNCGDSIHQ